MSKQNIMKDIFIVQNVHDQGCVDASSLKIVAQQVADLLLAGRHGPDAPGEADVVLGKGQMGSPKSARVCLFPQSDKNHCFCTGPISVDPIRPFPKSSDGV